MAKSEDDEIDFDHLVTFESKKRVAATAFVSGGLRSVPDQREDC